MCEVAGESASRYVWHLGMTNNFARRYAEHIRTSGRRVQAKISNLSRFDAHAVEQAYIARHGLARNGGRLTNRVNSVSRRDPLYRVYVWRGNRILSRHGLH